jgi:hypothetical protein
VAAGGAGSDASDVLWEGIYHNRVDRSLHDGAPVTVGAGPWHDPLLMKVSKGTVRGAWTAMPWVMLAAVVVFGIGWIARLYLSTPVWGTVAAWVGAFVTFLAVAVSVLVADVSRRQAKRAHESEERWREAEEDRRLFDDARKLSWWVSEINRHAPAPEDWPPRIRPFLHQAHQLAYGINWEPESAIVLCVVTVSNRGDSALSAGLLCPLNVPEELRGDSPPVWEVGIIAPGETFLGVYQRIDGTHFSKAKLDVRVGTNPGVAWIEYRDAAGNYWRRLGDGALERRNGPWQPSEDHQPQ